MTTPAGIRGVSSGFGGPADASSLNDSGVAVDHSGNLVIADKFHVAVVAAKTGTFYGQPMTAGHLYSVAGNGKEDEPANGTVATQAPLGGGSYGVTVDSRLVTG